MPKILPKASQVESRWLAQVATMPPGEELYINALNKKDQTSKMKTFRELLAKMERFDPILAQRISIKPAHRDRKYWVVLLLSTQEELVAFTKSADGTVARVEVAIDPERPRIMRLMWDDGLSMDEISTILPYPLTSEECDRLRRRKK